MLSNVVGYARSRLFRNANDVLVPTVPAEANGQQQKVGILRTQSKSAMEKV
jgi:hypothetical protein